MRAVLDTNVIISGLGRASSVPGQILYQWRRNSYELIVSPLLLAEYQRALSYPHVQRFVGLSASRIAEALTGFSVAGIFVDPEEVAAVVSADPDDDVVIATAVAGNADYIISGDRHLLALGGYKGIRIVPPAVSLVILEHDL